MMRGRHGPHERPARFTAGGAAFAPAFGARPADRLSIRAALPAGLAASFLARPAARAVAWPGPLFWSHGGDDVFWPTAYDAAFWDYGPADMLGGILRPAYGGSSRLAARRGPRDDRAFAREEDANTVLCREQPSELTNLAAVEQDVRPTDAQRAAFDQLRATEAAATEIIRGACPASIPASPTGRRDAMAQWVDAILVAVRMVRPPLEAFYRSLDDEQKARFTSLGSAGHRGDAAESLLGNCRDPRDAASASVPVDPIVRRLRLTEAQAAALEEFSQTSDEAAQKVRDSCPRAAPLTPTGRIAAIEARLTALLGALDTLRAPLERFYTSLTDAQKAQFDRVGSRTTRRGG
jgi:hypothetical protein